MVGYILCIGIYMYNIQNHAVLIYIYNVVAGAVLINNVVRDTHTPFGGGRRSEGGGTVSLRAGGLGGVGIARIGRRAYHMVAHNL